MKIYKIAGGLQLLAKKGIFLKEKEKTDVLLLDEALSEKALEEAIEEEEKKAEEAKKDEKIGTTPAKDAWEDPNYDPMKVDPEFRKPEEQEMPVLTVIPLKEECPAEMLEAAPMEAPKEEIAPVRDYNAEWQEFMDAYPEYKGGSLPDDVFKACMMSDKPPLRVFEPMMIKKLSAENAALKKENEALKENAERLKRSPVSATTYGGKTALEPEDRFTQAFKSYH